MALRSVAPVTAPVRIPTTTRPGRIRLPAGWPLLGMLVLLPLWYLLGLGAFIWILLAVPMLFHLVMTRAWRAPRGFVLWAFFLLWTALSAVQLSSATDLLTYLFRTGTYVASTIGFLYLVGTTESEVPADRIVKAFTVCWAIIVAGGFAALAFPNLSFSTPVQKLLPASFLSNRWLYDLVHPSLSQAQGLGGVKALGHAITRPAAPFAYTNWWGANYALLLPFVILTRRWSSSRLARNGLAALLLVSLVPFIISINRGAWLSLIVGGLYAWARFAFRGNTRATAGVFALLVVIAVAVVATPLGGIVEERIQHEGSAGLRLSLYQGSVQGAMQSPLIGYAVPLPQPLSKYTLPNVGTQGQLWLVLVSVGFPGTFFFLAWLLYVFWASRSTSDQLSFTVHIVVLIGILHLPFYGWIPVEMFLFMAAAALIWRSDGVPERAPT